MGLVALAEAIALAIAVAALAGLLMRTRRESAVGLPMDILDRAHEAFIAIDSKGSVTAWNAAAETMFGWSREEAVRRELAELAVPTDMRSQYRRGFERARETGRGPVIGPRTEVIAQHRDGTEIPVELSISSAREPGGGFGFRGFVRDVTERKLLAVQQRQLGASAQHSARVDALTSLPNRRAWDEELERELARSRRGQGPMCVAVVDLDHFRAFNDAHGQPAGELALRASDFIARYGGEQFAVLLPDCGLDEAMSVIERMRRATPDGLTASVGVAEWNRYEAAEALIDRADLALHKARREGRNRSAAA
jgi:diguanylate cyclase (GGDEF)-like protein/PAS domain S-box-containing protein